MLNYNNRQFVSIENTKSGEVSSETYFDYYQEGNVFYGDYSGGEIIKGKIVGIVNPDDTLEFRYNHVNTSNEIRGGTCNSVPRLNAEGKIELHENWQWLDKSQTKGRSIVREV
ncbi:hypothetical protein SAMN05192559_107106 [Halobacillus karajensis]|uniref:n-acetylglutamate synthase n=1 Tax=Halobacillus karajensis TaxID=195088 RepID=UPI0008A80D9D|nr:n-acetylglutamate synthase [Halobacillus karajensis]SEI01309.1 hypothetical protein SAMN05192559_107106 [Halobacillus karajensis]